YPQLAAFDADTGTFERTEYHRFGEFQSDTSDYSVDIQTSGLVVGATGQRVAVTSGSRSALSVAAPAEAPRQSDPNSPASDRLRTIRFEARGVRDFAWVAGAYPQDLVGHSTDGIEVRVLAEGSESQAKKMLEISFAALEDFGKRYGRYP